MMNKDNRNDKIRKIAKKGLTFSLCAVPEPQGFRGFSVE